MEEAPEQMEEDFVANPIANPSQNALNRRWNLAISVIFCTFGSETFLSNDQIKELALGLELRGLPFFPVLNFPAKADAQTELDRALPDGFMERVKNKGVVHTGWVQQQLILAHSSVGCYVFHSGYSSIIEGLINDCQLVLLSFKGDQFLNSKLVSGDMRAGVEVNRREDNGHFRKEDIMEAVKTVMVDVNKEPGWINRQACDRMNGYDLHNNAGNHNLARPYP
ncbi:hypothetical protein EZV62_022260 [Acer yangbiense]|uniref:Uncharacterized protein n=1 Tax=Acer yangbiense TaxID=1000413 RepID=A0A5C7H815_9ROSI|nr:hypothetical protein EZV62_022260 [Acer yangbiense]